VFSQQANNFHQNSAHDSIFEPYKHLVSTSPRIVLNG